MKKLMIALVAATVAVIANAGSANWSCEALKVPGATVDLTGGLAMLFVGDSTDGIADSILAGTFTGAGAVRTGSFEGEDGLYVSKWGTYTSQTVSAYMVLFDADSIADAENFIVSNVESQTFGTSGNKTFNFSSSVNSSNWQAIGGSSVPEPTSGLLMLLGVAGLALRRKRA